MYEFDTPEPVRLRIEFGSGDIDIQATETSRTTVEVTPLRHDDASRQAAVETTVEQRGNEIVVDAPRRFGMFRRGPQLQLRAVVPLDSSLDAKVESADLTANGRYGDVGVKTGSGEVRIDRITGDANVQSGSGDIDIERTGRSARLQAGSGDVRVHSAHGSLNIGTGSGDIFVEEALGALQVNSGSGDVHVVDARSDVAVNTASGDQMLGRVCRGRVRANAASGDISVGVAEGTAAWLNVNTLTGTVHSQLDGSEPPEEGEDSVELRVNTVSGDITLSHA